MALGWHAEPGNPVQAQAEAQAAGGNLGQGGNDGTSNSAGSSGSLGGSGSLGSSGSLGMGGSAGSGTSSYMPGPTAGGPCKILLFGDSITRGVKSSYDAGYRSQLFQLIVAAKQKATFTGSLTNGPLQVSGQTSRACTKAMPVGRSIPGIVYPDGLNGGWDVSANGVDMKFFDLLLESLSKDYQFLHGSLTQAMTRQSALLRARPREISGSKPMAAAR